ncbi:trypsin-like serine protease [Streptomyces sp. NRRL S-340]|uniref:trypsin-like serine protease n=1 Tax=Streptomyces sp. NRRL S-340 TaxID=1463901 RepID=UPI000A4F93CA|nr:trypsin-like serine protease [Streptomyces sp. NRRL S-340]
MRTTGIRTRRARGAMTAGVVLAVAAGVLSAAPAAQALSGKPAAAGDQAFTARLVIGEGDSMRSCSAALVHQQWLLTATSCFAPTPGAVVKPGKPALKTRATVGKQTLDVVEVVPRDDRDVAMARLAEPVTTVTPVALATDAPEAGETLLGTGFGRTGTEWVPDQLHTGEFRVDSVADTTVALTGQDGASVCKGDAGGPALRGNGGAVELTAVHSVSWQGGCLGETETRTGAVDARVDGLADWVKDVRNRDRSHSADVDGDGKADLIVLRSNGDVVVYRNQGDTFAPGKVMSGGWDRFVTWKDLGRLYFADVDGDGKADMIVHTTDGNIAVRTNRGTYWDQGKQWSGGWARFIGSSTRRTGTSPSAPTAGSSTRRTGTSPSAPTAARTGTRASSGPAAGTASSTAPGWVSWSSVTQAATARPTCSSSPRTAKSRSVRTTAPTGTRARSCSLSDAAAPRAGNRLVRCEDRYPRRESCPVLMSCVCVVVAVGDSACSVPLVRGLCHPAGPSSVRLPAEGCS